MSRYIGSRISGGTFFFTVNLQDRSSDLLTRHVKLLRRAYASVHARHPFDTIAVSVIPDHLHAIWKLPEDDGNHSLRWSQIKHAFSHALPDCRRTASQTAKREKGIWQRRYWEHQIRDARDLAAHVDYVHFNPVKHGHAYRVADWPYSSFHRWVKRGLLDESWGLVAATDGQWGEW